MKEVKSQADAKQIVIDSWWQGIHSVNGRRLVSEQLARQQNNSVTHILSIGKAAASMILGALDHLNSLADGLVVTKYGHGHRELSKFPNINLIESGHPVADENSLLAGERCLEFVKSIACDQHLLILVSGGASALVELLVDGITLTQLQNLNNKWLASGDSIAHINALRQDYSLLKGGKLLAHCAAQNITVYAVSDVPNDDIKIIGSGIGQYDQAPENVHILGSNKVARSQVETYLTSLGIPILINNENLYADVMVLAGEIADTITSGQSGAYIFGGESTIILPKNPGSGGRNQSLALALAIQIKHQTNIVILAAATDGTDGPTQAAGGLVTGDTFKQGAEDALHKADAGAFLTQQKALFVTGPTDTNVMDLVVAIKY